MSPREKQWLFLFAFFILLSPLSLLAQREPVLKQIDLPHSYYFREMYLPQLTTGPGSVAWSPDGKWLVYSMAGSLWRQRPDSEIAVQLTAGPGYDYMPDWSPDGRWIVFCRYDGESIELWLLDVESGAQKQLTQGSHVNVEPRWSPDGSRIAYVSTAYNRRFHIFVVHMKDGEPASVAFPIERLTGETRSDKPRYYYSQFDHEISPAWSPDGKQLLFVSNRGHFYGTGGFWLMPAEPGAEAREIHREETTWKARPDWSRDGKRLVFSSYLGGQWHQLWVMRAEGGSPFPLTYGDFDNTAARWSPDGSRIAFISNRTGNTSLWLIDVPGGAQRQLTTRERKYLRPMGKLRITVLDAAGRPTAARVSVTDSEGRAYAPDDAWMHADDGLVRAERRFEAHYFDTAGQSDLTVPAGRFEVEVMKGFEHRAERRRADVSAERPTTVPVRLRPLAPLPATAGKRWASGDLHVHMDYAGAYRNTPAHLAEQAAAENLNVVHNLIVNKEQRIPDVAYFTGKPDPVSSANFLLLHDQEFHTSYWGHMGLLGLTRNLLIPDYAGYPETAAASLWPMNSFVADLAHQQGALVGYVHPYEIEDVPDPAKERPLRHAFVVDAALGKVDYVEVLGFSDHQSTASIWYRLLNLGLRIPAGAGTDAMANYASLHGPVGLNRVYARVPAAPLKRETWLEAVRRGNGFATNGPLLDFTLGGQTIGGELKLPATDPEVRFTASMRSLVPLDHLEVVCNGKVVRELEMNAGHDQADLRGTVPITASGWCLLRAWSAQPQHPILDTYPYATTSPIYVTVNGERPRSPEDAAFCIAWIDRIRESVEKFTDWNTDAERADTFRMLSEARKVYEGMLK